MKWAEKFFLIFSGFCSLILLSAVIFTALVKQGVIEFPFEEASLHVDNVEKETSANAELETEESEIYENYEEQVTSANSWTEEMSEEDMAPTVYIELESEVEAETEEDPFPYYIRVNKILNCVTIYERDHNGEYTIPFKSMICSTGTATPLGTFGSKGKYEMKGLIHGVFGQYATWITGNILFHSVPCNRKSKDSLSARSYNQLGTKASAGCIRLTVADAKWIYDHCPLGTMIEIYDDKESPGPLGKPEAIKVPSGTKWDPTDPDPANPWHEFQPRIEMITPRVLQYGQFFDAKYAVNAYDTCGNLINEKLLVEGDLDIWEPGEYRIRYIVTDAIGKEAERVIAYVVQESARQMPYGYNMIK